MESLYLIKAVLRPTQDLLSIMKYEFCEDISLGDFSFNDPAHMEPMHK